jgi:hypothetical protein
VDRLDGFCLLLKRQVLGKIGVQLFTLLSHTQCVSLEELFSIP